MHSNSNVNDNRTDTVTTTMTNDNVVANVSRVNGTIVVVAKCPIPGKSKTRLIPLLGKEGSTKLAKAMLSDVLQTITKCVSLLRFLFVGGGEGVVASNDAVQRESKV